jgi:hypothetical protein
MAHLQNSTKPIRGPKVRANIRYEHPEKIHWSMITIPYYLVAFINMAIFGGLRGLSIFGQR